MAFPQTPLDIKADLKVGGVWQDVTADVYTRDLMSIARGRPDEGSRTDPGKCKLTFNNGASKASPGVLGRYSPGNPLSDLYGLIGRNTQVRVHLPAAEAHVELDGDTTGTVSTPHAAALNITGDLDVRVDIDADMTLTSGSYGIIGKWGETTAERAWVLRYTDGNLFLTWLDSGTAVHGFFIGIELIGAPVLRVTVDVDNGAGGHTVRFYQGDSVDGTEWTQLYTDLVGSGTTSIQSTTSPVRIGVPDSTLGRVPFIGSGTRFQIRSGIAGTIVANADFRPLADGATGFTDSAGRVWTVNGTADVRKRADRFVGEISAWPPRWDVSGNDRWVPVEAAGVLRRYGQGASPLQSTLRRRIPAYSPVAYWPMEEGSNAVSVSSPITAVSAFTPTGFDFASDDTLPGSASLPTIASGATFTAKVPPATAGTWQMEFVYFLETMPASLTTMIELRTTGTARRVLVRVATNNVRMECYDADGTQIALGNVTAPSFTGGWNRLQLRASTSGASVTYTVRWIDIGALAYQTTDTITASAGYITSVQNTFDSSLAGLRLGHLAVFTSLTDVPFSNADKAFIGEEAGERALRLATEENVPLSVRGVIAEQEKMGSQRQLSLLELLAECAASDGGILMEHRARPALRYRGRATLYNQTPALTLSYTTDGEIAPPLEPLDDDADIVNDVTVTRIDGSSARAVLEEGALSVQAPPDGVGRYDTSLQLSLAADAQAEPIAWWKLHLGTWDAPRYPVVHVDLAAAPHLIDTVLDVDQGDVIRLTDLPAWLPPGDVDLIVQGYTESFDQYAWDIYFTCTPAGPWTVAVTDDDVLAKADTAGSELLTGVTSSATQLLVATTRGPRWTTDAAELPFDIRAGGEVMTVSGIASWLRDALGRTVSGGWGTADSGQVWSAAGGTVSTDFAVGSGYGQHILTTTGASRRSFTDFTWPDVDVVASVTTSATATGASLFGGPTARYADSDNLYMARVEFTTGNAVLLDVRKRVAAVESSLGTYTSPITHVAGTFVRVRLQISGSTILAKVWPASGVEPLHWHVGVTDTSLTTSAFVGCRSIAASGNTNVNPQVRYDNVEVLNPQTFTVVRSVNGIVKAQAAGADVRLAQPAIVAL